MHELLQSTAIDIYILMVDATDDETAETGKSLTVYISKNGGSFATATNSATEISRGWYKITLTTTEVNTLGFLVMEAEASGCDIWRMMYKVVAPNPDNLATASALTTLTNYVDTEIAAILAAVDTEIAAIKAKTDNLPASPAAVGSAMTLAADSVNSSALATTAVTEMQSGLATSSAVATLTAYVDTEIAAILAAVDTEIAAIKAKTDNLPASPAAVGSAMTLSDGAISTAKIADGAITNAKVADDVAVVVADKTGFKLAADGLDSISTTAPTGVATNFREMLVQVWRLFFKRVTETAAERKTYADNGTTVMTTQTLSDNGTTQEQSAAS